MFICCLCSLFSSLNLVKAAVCEASSPFHSVVRSSLLNTIFFLNYVFMSVNLVSSIIILGSITF